MIEHLIFDLDGTIVNSYPHFVEFFYEVCKKNGVEVPCDRETVYRLLKMTVPEAYARLNCEDKMSYDKFYGDFVELYAQNYEKLMGFDETISLIRKAKEAGKQNYLYTHTGPVAKDILKNLGVLDCFEFVLDASYHFPLKPAPDALLFLAEKNGLDVKECIMIGDRPIDALAGMNAGMVGFLWDEDDLYKDIKVDYHSKDINDVAKIVGI